MNGTAYTLSFGNLADELDKSFVEDVKWPVDRATLAALLDMGLSPRRIAQLFSVRLTDVVRLLHAAGMTAADKYSDQE
jgi:hypothetical protein